MADPQEGGLREMKVPHKELWKASGSGGEPGLAVDGLYATTWISEPSTHPWLEIDLGEAATLAGLEVYWGKHPPGAYAFESSLDDKSWSHLCGRITARADRTFLPFLRSRPASSAGLAIRSRSKARRSSNSTSTARPRRRRCWSATGLRRSATLP